MNTARITGIAAMLLIMCGLIPWFSAYLFLALIGDTTTQPGPLALFDYWRAFAGTSYSMKLYIATASPWLLFLGAGVALLLNRPNTQHGDAHFASENEIRKAGLRSTDGLLLGKKGGAYLCASGQLGAIMFAPPRSGKGVGFGVPNLLNWQGSAIVTDIKLENYEVTSRFRQVHGQRIVNFSPLAADGRTHRYNPLDFVSHDANLRVNDLQKLTFKLLPTPENDNPMWANEGRDLLEGFILYLMDVDPPATLGRTLRLIRGIEDVPAWAKDKMERYSSRLDQHTRLAFTGFMQKSKKEQSGVLSSVKGALALWSNPLVDYATAATDFDPGQLRAKRMTIYVGIQPGDIGRLAPLVSMFLQQTFDTLLQRLPGENDPHQVLALLDEFTAMGRLANVEKGIAYFASYNICLAPIIQDLTQLNAVYGPDMAKTFLSTSRYRVAFAQNNDETAEYISRQLGQKTIRTKSDSRRTNDLYTNISHSHTGRPLLFAHDIMQLPRRDELILAENSPAIRARKIVYFKERAFKKRLLGAAPLPTSILPEPAYTENSVAEPAPQAAPETAPADNGTPEESGPDPAADNNENPPTDPAGHDADDEAIAASLHQSAG